jgi:hypothetical protein
MPDRVVLKDERRKSNIYFCFFIFSHSAFDVGRSMFDVHLFNYPHNNNLALMGINPASQLLTFFFSDFRIFSRGIMSRRSSKSEVGSPALPDDDGSAFRIRFIPTFLPSQLLTFFFSAIRNPKSAIKSSQSTPFSQIIEYPCPLPTHMVLKPYRAFGFSLNRPHKNATRRGPDAANG